MKIINDHFKVGQEYVGMMNGTPFTVVKIQPPGRYENKYGYFDTVKRTLIHFRDENTGRVYIKELETAKRLLLRLK